MSTTIVHLVRHGEVYNPAKILYGRMPGYHLSSRGQSQAARTAQSFRGHEVAYLAASPLERVQETAAPLSEVTGCEVRTDEALLEAGNRFEGLRTKGPSPRCTGGPPASRWRTTRPRAAATLPP